ncbi:hypothetical protein VaNZ11_013331 [Volvox africanus]|uniref:Ubiquitin-like modifier-activating enzyme ATG7 n=1 Tax=Volvox africanus TaxID=51714 RepID=A0ABQ5SHZ5_9CHLO|nr:hypothetical protein VaNZ11_013331 [Volvox africanus]
MAKSSEVLRFSQLQSVVDVTFLAELSELKLNVWKLSENPVEIAGYFSPNRYDSVPARLQLDVSSLRPSATSRLDCHAAPGRLLLFNTMEGFRGCDKQKVLREAAEAIWSDISSGAAEAEPWRLCRFLLLVHGDLKHYKFHYWFAFPVLKPPAPFALDTPPTILSAAFPASAVELISSACAAWRHPAAVRAADTYADASSPPLDTYTNPASSVAEVLARTPTPFWLLSSSDDDFSDDVAAHPLSVWAELLQQRDSTAAPSRGIPLDSSGGSGETGRGEGPSCGDGGRTARRHVLLVFSDASNQVLHPGWQLRNMLLMAAARWRLRHLKVLCLRESSRGGGRLDPQRSMMLSVTLPDIDPDSWPPLSTPASATATAAATQSTAVLRCPDAVGWEANSQGKLLPRVLDLGPHLRPEAQAEQAVDLNLRLMRWRAVPELEVGALAATRCLLLGAGTLGCAVARTLQGWGVRHITLVDSGRVAFSNPVRQSLYTFDDCLGGGRPKAEAAAEALRRIFPSAVTRGIQLSIPMPGHPPAGPADEETLAQATQQLDSLVSEHDAVFLLTDTRESRWLPALLAAARDRIAITAAVGFDSFLVMRHGAPPNASNEPPPAAVTSASTTGGATAASTTATHSAISRRRLGCYFCNDVFAPTNSTTDRSLDQQCTVARPGLAPLAGALAVELLAAMVQYGTREVALCAPPPSLAALQSGDHRPLGPAPHMVRGQLSSFSQVLMEGWAFAQCTACSAAVVEAYRARGWNLVREALQSPAALETLTGLSELHASTAAMMEDDEFEEGEDAAEREVESGGVARKDKASGAGGLGLSGEAGAQVEAGEGDNEWTAL